MPRSTGEVPEHWRTPQPGAHRAGEKSERARDRAERRKASDAAYYQANKAKIKEGQQRYRDTHKEETKARDAAYRVASKEKISEYNAGRKEQRREYRVANKKRRNSYNVSYRAAHPEKDASHSAMRRARLAGATTVQRAEIEAIYRKAREQEVLRCYICKKLIPLGDRHVDHIFPVSKGGPTRPSNLGITHSKCNLSKGAKHPNELGLLI